MKRLFYLINFEMRAVGKRVLVLGLCMVIVQVFSFMIVIFNQKNNHLRFEDLLNTAGYPIVFYVFLGVLLVMIVLKFYENFYNSKSIYSLMTLPCKRSNIFISKYISMLMCILFFAAVQISNIFFTYAVYVFSFPDIPKINNALFLAFMRSGFLRFLMPFHVLPFIVTLVSLASLAAAVLYGVICERAGNLAGLIIFPALLLGSLIYTVSGSYTAYYDGISSVIAGLSIMIAITAFMIYYSLKAVEGTRIL